MLRKPAAGATDTAFRQRIRSVAAAEMVDHAVNQSASRAGPLFAAVRDHHSQQDRTGLGRRTGAGEFGFVGLGAHRGDRLP